MLDAVAAGRLVSVAFDLVSTISRLGIDEEICLTFRRAHNVHAGLEAVRFGRS